MIFKPISQSNNFTPHNVTRRVIYISSMVYNDDDQRDLRSSFILHAEPSKLKTGVSANLFNGRQATSVLIVLQSFNLMYICYENKCSRPYVSLWLLLLKYRPRSFHIIFKLRMTCQQEKYNQIIFPLISVTNYPDDVALQCTKWRWAPLQQQLCRAKPKGSICLLYK